MTGRVSSYGMNMKKILSIILTASLVFSGFSYFSPYQKQALAQPPDETVSITDLSKYETNEVIVVYKKEKNATQKKTLSICSLSNSQKQQAQVDSLTDSTVVLRLDSQDALATAVDALSQDSSVDYIQPNYIYKAIDTNVSTILSDFENNSYFSKQWGYYNDGLLYYDEYDYRTTRSGSWLNSLNTKTQSGTDNMLTVFSTEDIDINLPEAWSVCKPAQREAIVAIVDTGIKYDHEELKDCIWVNEDEIPDNNIDDDKNGFIDDVHGWNFYGNTITTGTWPFEYETGDGVGNNNYYNPDSEVEDAHGTHCAGTIAAKNDSVGILGIASNSKVKIMTVKALGGEEGYGSTESVIKGIRYAEKNGATICNLSLGGEDDDLALRSVIKNSSMLFTIAAGNGDSTYNGVNNDSKPTYPASYTYNNIISVANLQCDGTLHYSSNYGAKSIHLAAPGSYIYSTSTCSEGYEYMSGTSMAAPMVAGVAAMLYSCYPQYSILDIRTAILNNTRNLDALSGYCKTGGMLDAYKAVTYLNSGQLVPTTPTPTTTPKPTATTRVTSTPFVSTKPTNTVNPGVSSTPTTSPRVTTTPYVKPTPTATVAPVVSNTPVASPKSTSGTSKPIYHTETPYVAPLSIDALYLSKKNCKIGSTNIISANASGATGSYSYRFLISKNQQVLVDKTTTINSISWTPTTSGTYLIQVYVTDANGDHSFKAIAATVSKLKVNQVCFNKTLKKGTTVKISTSTTYGIAPFTYEFCIYRNGKKVSTKKTSKNYITYKFSKTGTYKFKITIKDSRGNKASKTVTKKVKR